MFVNMSNNCLEIVYEGWLTKSPPTKSIWKARWRRRWFVLKHSGELPGQYFLLYYTDRNCRKLKGTIDLDQCEQVDAGLRFENNKQNYPHMFDVKTHKRTYYLAADSEVDMNRWVDCICQVCGLKASNDDTSVEFTEEVNDNLLSPVDRVDVESPPVSPASTMSGPYIPISECISGKPLNTALGMTDFKNILSKQSSRPQMLENRAKCNSKDSLNKLNQAHSMKQNNTSAAVSGYDINLKKTVFSDDISKCDTRPVTLVMTMSSTERLNSIYGDKNIIMSKENLENCKSNKLSNLECAKKLSECQDEVTTDEFYDSPRKIILDVADNEEVPAPNWETFPNDFTSSDIGSWSVQNRCGKLQVVESKAPIVTNSLHRNIKQKHQLDTMSLRRPPPRPPKPSHLILTNENCNVSENHSPCTPNSAKDVISDDLYDFPRSHQRAEDVCQAVNNRHNYTNAAPGHCDNVFRYDFTDPIVETHAFEPISPRSEGSGIVYSNLPSPLVTSADIPTPPAVNRELKPCRKLSDSGASNEPSPGGPLTSPGFLPPEPSPTSFSSTAPPSIDRKLKPRKAQSEGALKLAPPPDGSLRKVRAAPSPTPPPLKNSKTRTDCSSSEEDPRYSPDDEPIYFYQDTNNFYIPPSKKGDAVQYIILDMKPDGTSNGSPSLLPPTVGAAATATVYKEVDFLKTEAFKRTRQKVEEERAQGIVE